MSAVGGEARVTSPRGASMGLHHDDHFKWLKMLQDVDAILADCGDLVEEHGLDLEATRKAINRCAALPSLCLR
jgi:hypothetical protein